MENTENKISLGRVLLVIGVVAVLALGAYYLYSHFHKAKNEPTTKIHSFTMTRLPAGEMPKKLPQDIVGEADIKILDNYSASDKSGLSQDTFRYVSRNDIPTNIKYYTEYLTKNNWTIIDNGVGNQVFASLIAKKDIYTIYLDFSLNSKTKEYSVDITQIYSTANQTGAKKSEVNIALNAGSNLAAVGAPTSGLVGYWMFDQGSGTSAIDSSGSGNTGTLIGGPTWIAGKLGTNALNFPTNATVQIPNNASLSPGSRMTVAFWAKQNSAIQTAGLIGKWIYSTQQSWLVRTRPNSSIRVNIPPAISDPSYTVAAETPAGSWSTGTWNHVAFVYDGTQSSNANRLKVYINGVAQTLSFQGTIPSALANANAPINIGMSSEGAWNGDMDEVYIYNRALTPAEITSIYTAENEKIFTMSLTPGIRTIYQGETTTYRVNIYTTHAGTLDLALIDCPQNATCSFDEGYTHTFTSSSADDSKIVTLRIVAGAVAPNTYDITVDGEINSVFRTDTKSLVVLPPPTGCDSTPGSNFMKGCVYSGTSFDSYEEIAPPGPTAVGNADNFTALGFNWGIGGPSGMTDNFSVRWQGTFNFTGGTYIFTANGMNDGYRVYIDDVIIAPEMDRWFLQCCAIQTASRSISAGTHTIKVEHYDLSGSARADLSWALQASATAEIWANGDDNEITIPYNTSVDISWESDGADSCIVNPPLWSGTSGTENSLDLTAGRTYDIFCSPPSPAGLKDSVIVNVEQPPNNTLIVTKFGQGSITSTPAGIICDSDCTEQYPSNTSVTLTVNPAPNRVFTGWQGVTCTGAGETQKSLNCTFDMSNSRDIKVNFSVDPIYQEI